jgi:hypothetical protein
MVTAYYQSLSRKIRTNQNNKSMKYPHKDYSLAAILIASASLVGGAGAAVTVDYSDIAGGLEVTWSGDINTTDLTLWRSNIDLSSPFSRIITQQFIATTGIGSSMNAWTGMSVPGVPVATIGEVYEGEIAVGSTPFAYQVSPLIWLPSTYASGSPIYGSSFFVGESIASTGINDSFQLTWGSGANADSLSVTLNSSAAPEPSSVMLLGLGALGVVSRRRRTS